ncbi:hypothetical protein ACHZ97_14275 [Lysobacter soli]|uniref:hypothetical protein n=1 Tax=Lysobacter soli TaxID=453783 RepID=UPI0037C9E98F
MSGATIGGVVGAFVGFWFGGPSGAQAGWMIGSAIGGYVDPVQIKGPRITDAMQTVASVGHPIPFGYGTFSVGGTVIWWDELKEHKKTKRQGKGGGAKTTTYTYTRSYAVAFCEPIAGYISIKRNGKVVYTSDPYAPAEDLEYANKWLQKATLYLGGEGQMPDSTIVAVEGVGNVSPFRDLSYVVIENDDLTELAGAIPQYEAVVNATPPTVFLTSPPYSVLSIDSFAMHAAPRPNGGIFTNDDALLFECSPIGGEVREMVRNLASSDALTFAAVSAGGERTGIQQVFLSAPTERVGFGASSIGGTLHTTLVVYPNWPPEQITLSSIALGGTRA